MKAWSLCETGQGARQFCAGFLQRHIVPHHAHDVRLAVEIFDEGLGKTALSIIEFGDDLDPANDVAAEFSSSAAGINTPDVRHRRPSAARIDRETIFSPENALHNRISGRYISHSIARYLDGVFLMNGRIENRLPGSRGGNFLSPLK